MQAVILAGGFGNRLKPVTDSFIKPMVPVDGSPIIDYEVAHLNRYNVKDISFTLCHRPYEVMKWASGYKNLQIKYSIEPQPLGTCGSVRYCLKKFNVTDDIILIASGDTITDIDYAQMLEFHISSGADVTMAVVKKKDFSGYGVVKLTKTGKVASFIEKPQKAEGDFFVNTGCYIINRSVFDTVPDGVPFDFSLDLFKTDGLEIYGYIHSGYWSDLGKISALFEANFYFKRNKFFNSVHNIYRDTVKLRSYSNIASDVAPSAKISGKVYDCIIGPGVKVENGADLTRCVVYDNAVVRGFHYGEIIGNGYAEKIDLMLNLDNNSEFMTNITKNL